VRYRGGTWLGRFTAELEIEAPGSEDISLVTSQKPGLTAELRTRFKSFAFADRSTRIFAHFDRITGAVRQFTKLTLGRRPDFKRYDFRSDGVDRLRVEPGAGELSQSPERWSGGRRSFHAFDPDRYGCHVVSDPGALAYWVTWGPAAVVTLAEHSGVCFFSGKTLYLVRFRYVGNASARVDYRVYEHGIGSRRLEQAAIERYEVVARPVAGDLDESPIHAKILIETDARVPWRFTISDGPLKVDLVLEEVVLGEP
jgi:hypothetical protein